MFKIINFKQDAFKKYLVTEISLDYKFSLRIEIRERDRQHMTKGPCMKTTHFLSSLLFASSTLHQKILVLSPPREKSSPRSVSSVNLCFCSLWVCGGETDLKGWVREEKDGQIHWDKTNYCLTILLAILTCQSSDILSLKLVNFLEAKTFSLFLVAPSKQLWISHAHTASNLLKQVSI